MRTLIYKRTHEGDPDEGGCFGVWDCMGRVRDYDYDAVIGIGGVGAESVANEIDGKLSWVGIGPKRGPVCGRASLVVFRRFRYFGKDGPDLWEVAPRLATRMYAVHAPRYVLGDFASAELAEIRRLLARANRAPPSAAYPAPRRSLCKLTSGC